jgi:hypothetical protein
MNRLPRPDQPDRPGPTRPPGPDPGAEAAWAALFAELPRLRPSAGFASRVVARLPRRRSWLAFPAVRAALVAALAVMAVSAAVLLPLLGPVASLVRPTGFPGLVIAGFTALTTRFATGLAAWIPIESAARVCGRLLLEPRLLLLLVVQFAIAVLALRGLVRIVASQRSYVHVPR